MKANRYFLLISLSGGAAWANLPPANPSEQLREKIQLLDLKRGVLEERLREKTRFYHQLSHGARTPQYIWQDEAAVGAQKKRLIELVKVAIREQIREIQNIDREKTEAIAEEDWLKIQEAESISQLKLAPTLAEQRAAADFSCGSLPVEPGANSILQLIQDFGVRTDPDTGLQWNSLGWWLSQVGGEVKSCANGIVAYSGHVVGRGRVLMVDHGHGTMTLYANLNDDPELSFPKGTVVKAGKVIGTPRERVYFEVRRNGLAINPRQVISQVKLAKVGL